jgi:hypothetical protein
VIAGLNDIAPGKQLTVRVKSADGKTKEFKVNQTMCVRVRLGAKSIV